MRARRRSRSVDRVRPCRSCRGTGSGASRPRPSTWRSRSVVRPNEPLSRAYSSLPTRISVVSSRRTTRRQHLLARQAGAAPGRASTRSRMRGRARGEGEHAVVLGLVAHLAPARVVAVLLAPARVAAGGLDVAGRMGRSRRPSRPAGSRARGCARASPRRGSSCRRADVAEAFPCCPYGGCRACRRW